MAPIDAAARPGPTDGNPSRAWLVLAAMVLPLLALSIDVNGVGTILPALGAELDVAGDQLGWVVSASTLAFALALIPVGRLAPRLGPRRLLLAGVTSFGLASLLCGVAPSFVVLLVGRAVQGLASALCFTTSLVVIDKVFDARRRAAAIGVWGAVSGLGGAIGPLVGGAVTSWWSWRGFFVVNVPLCLLAVPVIAALAPGDDRAGAVVDRLPWPRLALLGGATVAITAGAQSAGSAGWWSPVPVIGLVVAVALVVALVATRRGRAPLVSPAVTRTPWFPAASVVAFCANWGFGVTVVVMGIYLQAVLGLDPLDAGLAFCAFSATFALAGALVSRLARRLGLRRALALAMVVNVVAFLVRLGLDDATALSVVVAGLALGGLGQGLAFDLSTTASLQDVPVAAAGEASGVVQTLRLVALSLGVAVSSSVAVAVGGTAAPAGGSAGVRAAMALAAVVSLVGVAGAFAGRGGAGVGRGRGAAAPSDAGPAAAGSGARR